MKMLNKVNKLNKFIACFQFDIIQFFVPDYTFSFLCLLMQIKTFFFLSTLITPQSSLTSQLLIIINYVIIT